MDPSTVALIFYFSWGDSDPQSFLPDILPNLVHDTQWPESAQQTCIKEASRIQMRNSNMEDCKKVCGRLSENPEDNSYM